ncbi:hypothetical protein A9K97_gp132 [Tokyovirus A1]|uniref:hypothetical protein n=1 Tax=Tokyovirus A1 TaxID=1826170 RepID=UPI0007A96822|nr:hypothetical protein A9K97_gp132 [Tokyovirus A1]BAU80219.1 hypothetical protein [Tokyovirus A1]
MEQTIQRAIFSIDSKRNASEYGVPTLDADTCRELIDSVLSSIPEDKQVDSVLHLVSAKEALGDGSLDFDSARYYLKRAVRELCW